MAIKRDENGRFVTGSVANPKGRPKTKEKILRWGFESPDDIDILYPAIIHRLADLMQSDDEDIAIQAAKILMDWKAEKDKIEALKAK